ncbi:MAG: 2Fe-2S iron-sulfur cluster-binding protein, partial [Promethearchaeota archaeon]
MSILKKFLIYRNDGNRNIRYDQFEIPIKKGMSILEALFYIQDYFDSSLAFRYACRGAICGSCGMTIDKVPLLACRTQVSMVKTMKKPINLPEFKFGDNSSWNKENEILIEPLPNMAVLKDLVVDMEPFWKFYKEVEPYFARSWNDIAPESGRFRVRGNVIDVIPAYEKNILRIELENNKIAKLK